MSFSQFSANAFSWALGWTLIHFLWQGTAIAVLLACILSLLHRRSAQLRYTLCCIALILMSALPLLTLWRLNHASFHAASTAFPMTAESISFLTNANVLHDSPLHHVVAVIDQSMPFLLISWLAGVLFLLIRLGAGLVVAQRMKRIGVLPISSELESIVPSLLERLAITRPVQLMHSALVQVPTVVGWLRPVILLPIGFLTGLTSAQVEAVLIHELAHIRRHDYLVSALQALIEAVLFYHPAVWWVSNKIRAEREHCCDDLAVAAAGSPVLYARALSLLEERRSQTTSSTPLIALAVNGGVLTMRIQRILGLAKGPVFPQPIAVLLLGALIAAIGVTTYSRAQSAVTAPQSASDISADESHIQHVYKIWLDEDVRWIIKPEERAAFLKLSSDDERDQFIQQFWLRRDPQGAAPNTSRAEHYHRLAYANQHFAAGKPGWQTDRGRIFIIFGPPSSVDAHPAGNDQNPKPFEVWTYDVVPGVGHHSEIRFVDDCSCGDYKVAGGSVREMDKDAH